MKIKPFLVGLLVLSVAAYALVGAYSKYWSPAARAQQAGDAFFRAAVAGDEERVAAWLAVDAELTPAEVVRLYQGLLYPKAFDVIKSLPNRSGVEYLVHAGGSDPTGFTKTTTFALKREDGRWVVLKAGSSFS
ncbi:MAG: hypothetical protein ACOY94_18995, partial [Bacillota bacterium]